MCELFTAKKFGNDTLDRQTLETVFTKALAAAETNPDGFGAFNDKGLRMRSGDKFSEKHLDALVDMFEGSGFVVLHLRMATTGEVSKDNSHPFISDGVIMSHNGIIRGVSDEPGQVDSERFLNRTTSAEGDTLSEKIQQAVKTCAGSFSNFLYNGDHLYYFRDRSSMTFAYHQRKNLMLGFTKEKRLKNLFDTKTNLKGFWSESDALLVSDTPRSGMLYEITENGVKEVSELDIGSEYTHSYGWYYKGRHTGYPEYGSRRVELPRKSSSSSGLGESYSDWVTDRSGQKQCNSCGRVFNTRFDVLQHIRDKHGQYLEELQHVSFPEAK